MNTILAKRIRKIRFESELDQERFASAIGAHRSSVSRWEAGKSEPKPAHLVRIAAIAGIAVDELLQGLGEVAA